MSIRWVDVSLPMHTDMTVWPGDPAFELKPFRRIAQGDTSNVSWVGLGTHTGTHVDAPWHGEEDGKRLHEMDTALFFGEALVLEFAEAGVIGVDDLGDSPLPPRVLFKTRNSALPLGEPFREDFVALSEDAAQRLVNDGVRLVGVDYLSVGPFGEEGALTHRRLLRSNILVVEGLRLAEAPAGACRFTVLPLPLYEADGAPCRAFVGIEGATS